MQQGLSCIPLKLLTVYFMVRTTGLFYLMALANWPWETKNSRHHEQVNGWINNFISVCCVTLLINRWGCHVILCMLYLLLIMLMHFASSTKEVEASFCHLELLAGVWIQTLPPALLEVKDTHHWPQNLAHWSLVCRLAGHSLGFLPSAPQTSYTTICACLSGGLDSSSVYCKRPCFLSWFGCTVNIINNKMAWKRLSIHHDRTISVQRLSQA